MEIARDCGRLWEVVGSGQMIVWVARGRGRSWEVAGDDGGVVGVGMVRFVNVVGDTEYRGGGWWWVGVVNMGKLAVRRGFDEMGRNLLHVASFGGELGDGMMGDVSGPISVT